MHVHTRYYALIAGILMVAAGALAFIPQLNSVIFPLPELNVVESYGLFLDNIPMNILNKVLLIAVGLVGVGVFFASNVEPSVKWSRCVAIVMTVLTLMGLFEMTNTFFGYMPLFGGMIVLNAVFALASGYYGYVVPARIRSHVVAKTTLNKTAHV